MSQRLSVRILSFSLFCLLSLAPARLSAQCINGWSPVNRYPFTVQGGGNLLLEVRDGVVYRSLDNGTTWEAGGSISGASVRSFIASAGSLFAATNKGVYRSDDGGQSWGAVNNGLQLPAPDGGATVPIIIGLVARANVLYAAAATTLTATTEVTGSIFASTDQGNTWVERQTGVSVYMAYSIRTADLVAGEDQTFFRDARGRIYTLNDNGQTLTEIESVNFATTIRSARNLVVVGRMLVAGGASTEENPFGMYRSDDGGRTWANSNTGIFRPSQASCTGLHIQDLIAHRDTIIALGVATCYTPLNEYFVYLSFDKGVSWTRIAAPIAGSRYSYLSALAANDTNIFASAGGTFFSGICRSSYPTPPPYPNFASVSAASYRQDDVVRASIVAGFGANLAANTEVATSLPLPTSLGGVSVLIKDSRGNEREAPLFFVSPAQINYQIPEDLTLYEYPDGSNFTEAEVTVKNNGATISLGRTIIHSFAPSLFTVDASGKGLPAASVLRIKADGTQSFEPVARFDSAANKFVPVPIDLGAETDRVYLLLFGTGIRGYRNLRGVNLYIPAFSDGNELIAIEYAGPAPGFVGLDQVNALLPRSLAGKGEIELQVRMVVGRTYASNKVRISVK